MVFLKLRESVFFLGFAGIDGKEKGFFVCLFVTLKMFVLFLKFFSLL
jgi:hypothetical protein